MNKSYFDSGPNNFKSAKFCARDKRSLEIAYSVPLNLVKYGEQLNKEIYICIYFTRVLLVTPVFLFIYYLLLNDIFNVMVNDISIHIFIIYHKNYSRIQIFDFNK